MSAAVGTVLEETLRFTQGDFDRFAELSGDHNPLHTDPRFAAGSRFGRTIGHGMLLYAALCAAMGRLLPGGRQLEQSLRFAAPVFADQPLTLRLEIAEQPSPGRVLLATLLHDPAADRDLLLGRALLATAEGIPVGGAADPPTAAGRFAAEGPALASFPLGRSAATRRNFDSDTVAAYRELTGDRELRYGSGEPSGIPGPLLAGAISALLGMRLPGPGTLWLEQTLRYRDGAEIGAEIGSRVEVTGAHPRKPLLQLQTTCSVGASRLLGGQALVLPPAP